jgi:hypothetical protein
VQSTEFDAGGGDLRTETLRDNGTTAVPDVCCVACRDRFSGRRLLLGVSARCVAGRRGGWRGG